MSQKILKVNVVGFEDVIIPEHIKLNYQNAGANNSVRLQQDVNTLIATENPVENFIKPLYDKIAALITDESFTATVTYLLDTKELFTVPINANTYLAYRIRDRAANETLVEIEISNFN